VHTQSDNIVNVSSGYDTHNTPSISLSIEMAIKHIAKNEMSLSILSTETETLNMIPVVTTHITNGSVGEFPEKHNFGQI
jgi:hypothetical protein